MRTALLGLAVLVLVGCSGDADKPWRERAMEALIEFAREPSEQNWLDVPLASYVDLGRGDRVRARRSDRALQKSEAWMLSVDGFRGRAGATSALELIAAENGELRIGSGPHRHCVSPPVPARPQAAGLERVYVQPRSIESCLQWWTVDAFLNEEGLIQAVTFDLYEP